jgi:hypothetical protein
VDSAPALLQFDVAELKGPLNLRAAEIADVVNAQCDSEDTDDDCEDAYDTNAPVEDVRGFFDMNDDEGQEEEEQEEEDANVVVSTVSPLAAEKVTGDTVSILQKEKQNVRFFFPMAGLLLLKAFMNLFVSEKKPSDNIRWLYKPISNVRKLQHYTPTLRYVPFILNLINNITYHR